MKLKILKKCWQVWDKNEHNRKGYADEYYEEIYAPTREKARKKFSVSSWVDYIDVRAVRYPEYDKVEWKGQIIPRYRVKSEEKQEERNKKILALPEDDMYYVQSGIVGNDLLLWGLGGSGYTCNIEQAQRYTKEQIVKQFTNGREQDVIWSAAHLEANIKKVVDSQSLDRKYSI